MSTSQAFSLLAQLADTVLTDLADSRATLFCADKAVSTFTRVRIWVAIDDRISKEALSSTVGCLSARSAFLINTGFAVSVDAFFAGFLNLKSMSGIADGSLGANETVSSLTRIGNRSSFGGFREVFATSVL